MHNHSVGKEEKLINLKKANTLTTRLIKMVESDEYCIDIMQQSLAVIGLLKALNLKLMEGHLNSCFKDAMASKDEKRKAEMIGEILKVTKLMTK